VVCFAFQNQYKTAYSLARAFFVHGIRAAACRGLDGGRLGDCLSVFTFDCARLLLEGVEIGNHEQ